MICIAVLSFGRAAAVPAANVAEQSRTCISSPSDNSPARVQRHTAPETRCLAASARCACFA